MNRELFLNRITTSLGRERINNAPNRSTLGVPAHYADHPFGQRAQQGDLPSEFKLELDLLGGYVEVVDTVLAASDWLTQFLQPHQNETVVTWNRSEFTGWEVDWLWGNPNVVAPGETDRKEISPELLSAGIGITGADYAIANTGSLLLTAAVGRPRSISLLPAIHVALVRESQIVARLGQAYELLFKSPIASSINLISGPSRSSDIENDLAIGVHGPVSVYVLICREL